MNIKVKKIHSTNQHTEQLFCAFAALSICRSFKSSLGLYDLASACKIMESRPDLKLAGKP